MAGSPLTRPGHRDASIPNPGVYIGKVTKVTGATCLVEIPRLARGYTYGPAPYPSEYGQGEDTANAEGHSHDLRQLAKGDRVAVAFLEGGHDEVVVLARLA